MAKPKPRPKAPVQKKPAPKKTAAPAINPSYIYLGLLVVVLALIGYIRLRLASFPLERDEGEYAYFGQLILRGVPPFKLAYNLKLPGTYYSYALIMGIFGQTASGIHTGLMLFNLGSLVFLFLITRKLVNDFAAVIAVAAAGIIFVSPSILGNAAHATQFVTFWMLGGTWLLLLAFERKKLLLFAGSGIMMGLSFLMKQSAVFFPVFGGLMILVYHFFSEEKKILKTLLSLVVYAACAILPLLIVFMVMSASGVFDTFWFWTFVYPKVYGSRVTMDHVWYLFNLSFQPMFAMFSAIWIAAGLGVVALFIYKGRAWNRIFILLFFIFSFLSVVPGFYFRQHYFVPFIPAVGIMAGLAYATINSFVEAKFRFIPVLTGLLFAILFIKDVNEQKPYFFEINPEELCRGVYRKNFFCEVIPISKYIESHSTEKDTVFVMGSEPEVLFYSKRTSATGYIYMYDLVFDHKYTDRLQKEMMHEVEQHHPKFILFVSCPYSWLAQSSKTDTIFHWFNRYAVANKYMPVGVVEYHFPDPSLYAWDNDALTFQRNSDQFMMLLKRPD
jgi:hypothetical protein